MKAALVDVIGRMSRLPPLPRDADRPVVQLGGDGGDSNQQLSFFFVQLLPGTRGPDRALSPLRRGRGQAAHRIGARRRAGRGSTAVRPTTCASRSIWRAPPRSASASRTSPARPRARPTCRPASSTSAGGSTRCATPAATTPRTSASSCSRGATASRCASRDVATVEMRPPDRSFFSYQNGNPAIGLQLVRAPGANVLGTLERSEEGRRRAARRAAARARPRHRAVVRCVGVHQARGQPADREPRRRRAARAGVRVVVHARLCARRC